MSSTSWLVISDDGQFVYVSNTSSANISSYRLGRDGTLTLINPAAGSTEAGSMPSDEALAADGRYLYVRNDLIGTINAFRVDQNGSLTFIASTPGLPPNAQGLAAR
jgi:6-phosphogluconolactonase (cycloisomerase 2 family)